MPVSTRYALPLLALIALAVGASAAQVLRPRQADPCREPDRLRLTSLIPGTVAEGEQRERYSKVVIQWSEGRLEGAERPALRFQIVRAFGSLPLFFQPFKVFGEKLEALNVETFPVQTDAGPIDVHVETTRMRDGAAFVAYFYVHGVEPVASPFFSKLRSSLHEMLTGTRPISVYIVTAVSPDPAGARKRAEAWLASAYEHFDATCRVSATAASPSAAPG